MKELVEKVKWYLTSAVAIIAALVALMAYVQLDLEPFKETTKITAVEVGEKIYVEWEVVLPVSSDVTLIYSVGNHQLEHFHFHGVDRYGWIDVISVPPEVHSDFDFIAEWEFKGWRTLWMPQSILFIVEIEHHE